MPNPEIQIDIGLLWNEAEITGELVGDFEIRATDTSEESLRLESIAREFRARAMSPPKELTFGIRLEESLSPERAREVLASAQDISQSFKGEVVEAGVNWGDGLDGRVWWPLLHAGSLHDAEEFLDELRNKTSLDPLALSIVSMESARDAAFELNMG
ncbi:MAG: hypothetical protein FJY66_04880, partial [Calditrichaeota bacterium]|nr:hypothetical protein [Calditrichota bacterium]